MRPTLPLLLATTALLGTGCGMSLHPRIGPEATEPGAIPGSTAVGGPRAFPYPPPASQPEQGELLRQICRTHGIPRGWIAIRYVAGAEECPNAPDGGDRYTAAVIRRYSTEPVGATLMVCADQRVPDGWTWERGSGSAGSCPGARVGEDSPTALVMRRIR
jgi:hypothetical protein